MEGSRWVYPASRHFPERIVGRAIQIGLIDANVNLLKLLSAGFERHNLGNSHSFYVGELPEKLRFDSAAFECLWQMHPVEYHEIKIRGRLVNTPRWHQAYGMDYHYTGRINRALPIPSLLNPLLAWTQENIDERLNGVLLNWYDGSLGHYIGRHRDSIKNLVE